MVHELSTFKEELTPPLSGLKVAAGKVFCRVGCVSTQWHNSAGTYPGTTCLLLAETSEQAVFQSWNLLDYKGFVHLFLANIFLQGTQLASVTAWDWKKFTLLWNCSEIFEHNTVNAWKHLSNLLIWLWAVWKQQSFHLEERWVKHFGDKKTLQACKISIK